MADINIDAHFDPDPTHLHDPASPVSWHAARACKVTFDPEVGNCFLVPSLDLQDNGHRDLPLWNRTYTTYKISGNFSLEIYDITFSNIKPKPRPKKAATAKTAKTAKKAAGAKTAGKSKTAGKTKAKGKPQKASKAKKAAKPKKRR
jgi:hypothetical protein